MLRRRAVPGHASAVRNGGRRPRPAPPDTHRFHGTAVPSRAGPAAENPRLGGAGRPSALPEPARSPSLDPRRSGVNGALARDSAPAVRVVVTPGLRRPHSGPCQGGPRFASRKTRSPFQRMPDRDSRVPVRVSQAPGPSPADPGMCQGGARFKVSRRRPVVHRRGRRAPSPPVVPSSAGAELLHRRASPFQRAAKPLHPTAKAVQPIAELLHPTAELLQRRMDPHHPRADLHLWRPDLRQPSETGLQRPSKPRHR